ncbi:Hydroxyacyl-coenzyme A dehydrogenase, mitochondrial [Chionoecetes opilio]|uniref:3-hydroxyacyl-CoA dehydrogenase n=1 Tax=Chionoecetes opilio TaxID=41210 RepID=A0A8J5CPM5_CHIOP|nr:Hydroxyacyl-coenzyme A dehydrogenase, mitochondrial [Chionoecetes opilio]
MGASPAYAMLRAASVLISVALAFEPVVIKIPETSQATSDAMTAWGKAMGKTMVYCKDTPGFIVNRVFVPFLLNCIKLVDEGIASKEDIDCAIKLGLGHPMGPLELVDHVGLDTLAFVSQEWCKAYPDMPEFNRPPLLDKMVAEGKFGHKNGEGFYKYKL